MKKTIKRYENRSIFDKDYYRFKAMIRDPWFIKRINLLKTRLSEIGCPLPEKHFEKYKDYMDWNEKYWNRYTEMECSQEFLQEKTRITGNKEVLTLEEFYALENFRENFLPPIYGAIINEILEHFNIDPKERDFHDFVVFYLFFGAREYKVSSFMIRWIKDPATNNFDLYIKIYGHTKKEDIMRNWSRIAHEQKDLENFIGKNKEWKTFDRDIEIYNIYKQMKDPDVKRRENFQALDYRIYIGLGKKWPELTIGNIRAIVRRTKKRLGEI